MNINIRAIEGETMLETLYAMNSYAFHPSPPFQNKEDWMSIVGERQGLCCYALYEAETPVSIAVSSPMTQNMRGKLFPASGIWGVSTVPPARRKGYCRSVMASLLKAEKESGKVFSNLYPFRESFYERLGYVSFPMTKIARFSTSSLAPLLNIEAEGNIRLQLIGEAFDAYRSYLAEMRLHRHGMGLFDFGDRGRANKNLIWVALAEFTGKTEGLMLYRTAGEEVTKLNFIASRFYYQTGRARYLLLNWMARHIDQADQVELWLSEDEYPETWLADIQVKVETPTFPRGMSRVLDIAELDGMSVGEGSFSAQIVDPLCPWNEGSWKFESSSGRLKVSKSRHLDCRLTIQGLTALIAGAHDPQDFPQHGWGDLSPELQGRLRELFPRVRPFMHEMF